MEDMVIDPNWWQGRSVLVTGHTGFKGGWLSLWLERMGAMVTGFALPQTDKAGIFNAAHVGTVIESITGDLKEPAAIREAVEVADPDIVFHLAAQALVRESYADPIETFSTNVLGTVHLLEALRDRPNLRAIVVATSDKCYENREWVWGYRESDPLGGVDPYSASKSCQEHVVAAYAHSFYGAEGDFPGIATARAGNVIGGGDCGADRLVPDIIEAFAAGNPVPIRNPTATRPWQYVLDPLAGYLKLAQQLVAAPGPMSRAYNFGPVGDDIWTVSRVVERLAECWGGGASWQLDDDPHPQEAHALRLDATRARCDLQWKPLLDTQTALDWTLAWYRIQNDGGDIGTVTANQLDDYQRLHAATTR